jgi:hypothetical protein
MHQQSYLLLLIFLLLVPQLANVMDATFEASFQARTELMYAAQLLGLAACSDKSAAFAVSLHQVLPTPIG